MYKYIIRLLLFIFITPVFLSAQDIIPIATTTHQDSMLNIGIGLYDKNSFDQAIEIYSSILKENSTNVAALAELSMTYFAKQDYEKAITYAMEGLKYRSNYRPNLFLYLGNSYDMLGKREDAILAFRSGLIIKPTDHMLHYNLGLAHYRANEYDSARVHFQSALKLKPNHASSNLALGNIYKEMGKRIPAIFAFSRFLILEPNSNRSASIADALRSLLSDSLSAKPSEGGKITTTVIPDSDNVDGDIGTLELSLAITQVSRLMRDSIHASGLATIASDLASFFQITFELWENGKSEGFCWRYYVPYFATLHRRGFTDVVARYMFRSTDESEVLNYMRSNFKKAQEFKAWTTNYTWSY